MSDIYPIELNSPLKEGMILYGVTSLQETQKSYKIILFSTDQTITLLTISDKSSAIPVSSYDFIGNDCSIEGFVNTSSKRYNRDTLVDLSKKNLLSVVPYVTTDTLLDTLKQKHQFQKDTLKGFLITAMDFTPDDETKEIKIQAGTVLFGYMDELESQPHYKIVVSTHNKTVQYVSVTTTLNESTFGEKVEGVDFIPSSKITGFLNAKHVGRISYRNIVEMSDNNRIVRRSHTATPALFRRIQNLLDHIEHQNNMIKQSQEREKIQQENLRKQEEHINTQQDRMKAQEEHINTQKGQIQEKEVENDMMKWIAGLATAAAVITTAVLLNNDNDKNK